MVGLFYFRTVLTAVGFNLTNTPSFNAPATAIDTATAGRVTSTLSTPRPFQFGLRFNF
jgi:hypothetical protein